MRKLIKYFVLLFSIMILSLNFTIAHAAVKIEDTIIRNIFTKIEWDGVQKQIIIHQIYIQRLPDGSYIIKPEDSKIYVQQVKDKTLSDKEARDYVIKNSPEMFKTDYIFGRKVRVFKDLSEQDHVSEQKINESIAQAKEQIEKDYNAGRSAIENRQKESHPFSGWLQIFIWPSLIIVIIIVKVFLYYTNKKQRNHRRG